MDMYFSKVLFFFSPHKRKNSKVKKLFTIFLINNLSLSLISGTDCSVRLSSKNEFSLPDVLGPYDDSGRFWAYVEWVANSEEFPIELVNILFFPK